MRQYIIIFTSWSESTNISRRSVECNPARSYNSNDNRIVASRWMTKHLSHSHTHTHTTPSLSPQPQSILCVCISTRVHVPNQGEIDYIDQAHVIFPIRVAGLGPNTTTTAGQSVSTRQIYISRHGARDSDGMNGSHRVHTIAFV